MCLYLDNLEISQGIGDDGDNIRIDYPERSPSISPRCKQRNTINSEVGMK